MMNLRTFSGKEKDASFFLLNKGENAGKPSKTPWCPGNCFAVYTDEPEADFAKCYALFVAGRYRIYLRGSVIPFLVKYEMEKVLAGAGHIHPQGLQALYQLTELDQVYVKKREALKAYRVAFARQLLRKGGAI